MRTSLGIGMLVLGVAMTAYGLNSPDSLGSRLNRLQSEWPTERATWVLMAGILTVMIGLAMSAYRRKTQRS